METTLQFVGIFAKIIDAKIWDEKMYCDFVTLINIKHIQGSNIRKPTLGNAIPMYIKAPTIKIIIPSAMHLLCNHLISWAQNFVV